MSTPEQELTPDWVNEGDEDIEVGDLSAVAEDDVMETYRGVVFDIRKASLDTQDFKLDDGTKVWAKKNLHLQLNVAQPGIETTDADGNTVTKYANKAFFVNLLLQINKDEFPDAFKYDKYAADGKAWKPLKQFYRATGGDVAKISVTRAYRDGIVGQQVKADIIKRAKRTQSNGEWVDAGFENVLDNYRKVD